MKKFTFKRVISSVIAMILALGIMSSNLQPVATVYAAKASTSQSASTNTKGASNVATTKLKVGALKLKTKQVKEKEEYNKVKEFDSFLKERFDSRQAHKDEWESAALYATAANDAMPFVINTFKDLIDGGEFDTAALLTGVVDLAAGILSCIAPWGTVAAVGLQMAMAIFTACMGGAEAPSETQLMEDRLNQRLDEIADQISEVQSQLAEISDQINENTQMIIDSVSTTVENESDKNHLRDFMLSSGQGDFSYNQLRNYLYGTLDNNSNAMTAYYALVQDAQFNGGDSAEIKHYYDLLYKSLIDNRESFHHYITGDGFGKSIVQTYYDIVSQRPDLTSEMGKSAEMATFEFASDLYDTEMMMDQLILACNNYQYTQMLIYETDSYTYGSDSRDVVMKNRILNADKQSEIQKELAIGIDELRMQFAKDLVSVLSVIDSYIVEQNGEFYVHIPMEDEDTGAIYALVQEGQTLYLNDISAVACDYFDLDAQSFRYSGNGVIHDDGIVYVSSSNVNATIALDYYDEDGSVHSMGTIQLRESSGEVFSGGYGTEEDPYLIATAQQFLNIVEEGGMDQHYRLVNDINFGGEEIDALGYSLNSSDSEVYEEFTGSLDGDGFTIKEVKINSTINSGIFGKIGYGGVVKNLTLEDVEVNVSTTEVGKSTATFTGGVIAGINNGTIDSCTVTNCKVIVESSTTNEDAERNVYHKYGGVVGVNAGQIKAVQVKDSIVDLSSTHEFGGASTANNKNHVYGGGICGTNTGKLDYVGVNDGVEIKVFAKSVIDPKSTVRPKVKAHAGGITTHEGLKIENVTHIHSEVKGANVTAKYELKSKSGYKPGKKDAENKADVLIPTIKDDELDKITVTADDVKGAYFVDEVYKVTMTDSTEKYAAGALELNEENLKLNVDGKDVEEFLIMTIYGFNTKNESFDKTMDAEIDMIVKAVVDDKVVMLPCEFTITVDTNQVKSISLVNFDDVFFTTDELPTTATVEQVDALGRETTVNDAPITILNADTALSKLGTSNMEVEYQGVSCTVEIQVLCPVHLTHYDYSNTENFTFVQHVDATCQHGAYDEYLCRGCNESIQTGRTSAAPHKYTREIDIPATCARPGLIGKVYCVYCNEVVEEEVELPRLAHTIEMTGDADTHICTTCNKTFAHDYVVSESVKTSMVDGVEISALTYTYTCYTCGYVSEVEDTNIITKEESQRPAVVVSDGFATHTGELVTVYVDLENNPGVNGANFGIRYDERLELVNWYEGEFFASTSTEASHAVSCGYNFVWGSESLKEGKGGNLLELQFRLPEDATKDDSYEVAVVYSVVSGSQGGFAVPGYTSPLKFRTKDAVIRLVDRLPGDVDDSKKVDLRDALYLSNCLVNEQQYPITQEVKRYGDVNLDAMVTITDVVKVLQSISGGYGASLLAPEYRIQLNTNGYNYNPEALFVQLYGANNTYAALADIEQDMMQRAGYKFLGWYTRLEGGEKIDAANYLTKLVSYDQSQKIQTLYAHWQRNSVSFDVGDLTEGRLDAEIFEGQDKFITLVALEETYDVTFTSPDKTISKGETLVHLFDYWQGSDGVKYYAGDKIALHELNMGQLTLTAVWKGWTLEFPALEKTGYDASQIAWYTDSFLTKPLIADGELSENEYQLIKAMGKDNRILYAMWTAPHSYTVHYNANGGSGTVPSTTHYYGTATELTDAIFTRQYYVSWDYGWSGQTEAPDLVVHNPQRDEKKKPYWNRQTKDGWVLERMADNWTAENGAEITVYAVWDDQYIELTKPNVRTGYTFAGWYEDAQFTKQICSGDITSFMYKPTGECTLYAKWIANNYSIVYEHNTMGTGGAAVGNSDQCYTTPTMKTTGNPDYITYNQTGTYLDVPQTDHYNFVGWFTAPVGGTMIADSTGKVLIANAITQNNTQLYAHWTPLYSGTYVYDETSLKNIGTSGTYHIVKDIELTGTWTPKDSFSGTIDGHGHTIKGVKYNVTVDVGTNDVINYGFFRELTGTVKNITFDSISMEIIKKKDNQHNLNVGGVVGYLNGGTLDNVTMTDPYVYAEHKRDVASSGNYVNAFSGGIVGFMSSGTVTNCSATGSGGIYSWVGKATKEADAQSFSGGIVGYMTGGTVTGCSREDGVKVESKSEVDGKDSASRSVAGGIIGVRDGGSYSSLTSSNTNLKAEWSNGDYSKNYSYKQTGALVGKGG